MSSASISHAGPSKRRYTSSDLHHLEPEIIVIGAGIAGTSLSYALSHSGRNVLLLERDLSEPDRIVGELLQPGGVDALSKIGLEDVLNGIDATPVEGYCITSGVGGTRRVPIPYPAMDAMMGSDDVKRVSTEEEHTESEKPNGHSNGYANGHANGHANGDADLKKRKVKRKENGTTPESNGELTRWHVESVSGRKEGRSFHHGRLISSLRKRCIEDAPNLTVMEATVKDLIYCDHSSHVIGVTASFKVKSKRSPAPENGNPTENGAEANGVTEEVETVVKSIYAPLTIIADGCFSKFRSVKGSKIPPYKTRSHFVGVILDDVDLPSPRHGTVCLTPTGPVLLYQIGYDARETRMLVDVKGKLPSQADGSLKNFILDNYLPYLPENLHDAVRSALDTQRLRTMPNSFLPPSLQGSSSVTSLRGAVLVGDAYNMRHPLTGGGMTVAFNDAWILSSMLAPGGRLGLEKGREGLEDWGKISEGLREWFWERKNLAGVVNVLSMALYDLFGGAVHSEFGVLQEGCFRYLGLGGDRVAGPVGLLSAITPKPLLLFYHFFAVAFYSIYVLFSQGRPPAPGEKQHAPSWVEVPGLSVFAVKVFWTACVVLLPVIWTEFRV